MPLNTRSKKRENIDGSVEFSINDAAGQSIKLESNQVVKSVLFDISIIGCAISSPYLIPPGVILNIKIDPASFMATGMPERKTFMEFTCKVKSCMMKVSGTYRLGVQFKNPKKEDVDFIDTFIKISEQRKAPRWNMGK